MASAIERRVHVGALRVERRSGKTLVIRGHAAVFNQLSEDLGGFREQIAPGAFAEAIRHDDVRALINHSPNLVLGRNTAGTLRLGEDARGLAIEIDPPDTTFAQDLVVSMQRGDVTQMSFGFSLRPNGEDWSKDSSGRYVRTLKRLRLFDVSPVTFPAYPQTDVGLRGLEAFKRRLGTASAPSARWQDELKRRRLQLEQDEARFRERMDRRLGGHG